MIKIRKRILSVLYVVYTNHVILNDVYCESSLSTLGKRGTKVVEKRKISILFVSILSFFFLRFAVRIRVLSMAKNKEVLRYFLLSFFF